MEIGEKIGRTLARMRANPDDPCHGTHWGYRVGCRCERCREAFDAYMRGYRVAHGLATFPCDLTPGSRDTDAVSWLLGHGASAAKVAEAFCIEQGSLERAAARQGWIGEGAAA